MESKIALFDSNDVKVGETYMRRARQLVNQQRAEWVGGGMDAIKFVPDADGWDGDDAPAAKSADASADSKWIYTLAEKRVRDKRKAIIHTVVLLPGYFFFFLITLTLDSAYGDSFALFCMGFMYGVWSAVYAAHILYYRRTHPAELKSSRADRRKRMIEDEVNKLRRMGYAD